MNLKFSSQRFNSPAEFRGKRVVVMGLGLFGGALGAIRFLVRAGATVLVTDLKPPSRLLPSLEAIKGLPIELRLGEHREEDFLNCDFVLVSPAVPDTSPFLWIAFKNGARLITEMGLLFCFCRSEIIGVTGTNGKSTTSALLGEMVRNTGRVVYVGGNIGGSLLPEIQELPEEACVVLELSSFQLERLAPLGVAPHLSAITNLTSDHLDRHHTLQRYRIAKSWIVANQSHNDTALLSLDYPSTRSFLRLGYSTKLTFSLTDEQADFFIRGDEVFHNGKAILSLHGMKLKGRHNQENALCALACATAMGIAPNVIESVLRSFEALEHRLEEFALIDGITFINDSKATSPEATATSLRALEGNIVLIAGGREKPGFDYEPLLSEIKRKVKAVVLVGESAEKLQRLITASSPSTPVHPCQNIESASKKAFELAEPDWLVLFSPACTSYDMFSNYEERGRTFKESVGKLIGNSP